MNQLHFLVAGQKLRKSRNHPFPEMAAGTKNYYVAVFDLDEAWHGYACVGCFRTFRDTYYAPIKNRKCVIPEEALKYERFHVSVIGQKDDQRIVTNELTIMQIGGIRDA